MATDIRGLKGFGQSNMQGQGVTGTPSVLSDIALYSNGSNIVDYSTINDNQMFQQFVNDNATLNGTKYCISSYAVGGTSLFDNGDPDMNWSPTSNLRATWKQQILDANALFANAPAYNLTGWDMVYMLGETDAGTDTKTTEETRDAIIALYDDLSASVGIEKMYIVQLGEKRDGTNDTAFEKVREAQRQAAGLRDNIIIFYNRAESYKDYGWLLDDGSKVHYNQLAQNDIGRKLAEEINGSSVPVYRDSIYTETFSFDNCISYKKWNGNGEDEVNGVSDATLIGTATTETSTLINNQTDLVTDGTSYAELAESLIKHPCWTFDSWVFIPATWNRSDSRFFGDEQQLTTGGSNSGGSSFGGGSNFVISGRNGFSSYLYSSDGSPSTAGYLGQWVLLTSTYDGQTFKGYVDGIKAIENVQTVGTNIAPGKYLYGAGFQIDGVAQSIPNDGLRLVNSRIYNRALIESEVADTNRLNEPTLYNIYNQPVTPDAPIIVENNDTNIITITPATGLEVRVKGGSWSDTTSPYTVDYSTYDSFEVGEIEFRVKAEGVNPASDITANTIKFTVDDPISLVDVVLYSKDLDGIDTTAVKVKLINDSVQYKNNVVLRSETLTYTPDGVTGEVTMQLPDTDNMEDSENQYYVVEFTDSAYKIQVPNVSPVDFWDLNPTKTKTRI